MKTTILSLFLLIISQGIYSQNDTCKSSQAGNWTLSSRWTCDAGVSNPPTGSWNNGKVLVIRHNISIPNNTTIDLTTSGITKIYITSSGKINYGANGKIKLPSGSVVYLDTGATVETGNNSAGTLLEIGGNGIWGNGCTGCNNNDIAGPGFLDENSVAGSPLQSGNPLPIELISFSAKENLSKQVELNWSTSTEINNDYFDVQRSTDGYKWESIGRVNGNGNSFETKHYSFTDRNPNAYLLYYRLIQYDFDGKSYTKPTIKIELEHEESDVLIYPNPTVNKELTISSASLTNANFQITDVSGKIVFTGKIKEEAVQNIQLQHLPNGLYFLSIQSESQHIFKRIVVQ
jgi:hypothetical protein